MGLLALLLALSAAGNLLLYSQWGSSRADAEAYAVQVDQLRKDTGRLQDQVAQLEATLSAERSASSQLQQRVQELEREAQSQRPTATATPSATSTTLLSPQEAALRQIEEAVVSIRTLQPTGPVARSFMSPADLRDFFLEIFDRDYPPDERDADQKLLAVLGLIRPDQDLVRVYLDVYSEQVLGLYDDETKRLYVISAQGGIGPQEKMTFAHEFTHALQDQHYDLRRLRPKKPDNIDRSMAASALMEGDANLLMALYARRELAREELAAAGRAAGSTDKIDSAPLIVREELYFPYTAGLQFVQYLYQRGGWAAVDAAYRDPPESTAQIIHPEKYVARERPARVDLPDLAGVLGGGWRLLRANTLGELDVRILLQQYTDLSTASQAAAGWRGDRYHLLEGPNGQLAIALLTLWNTSQDADEFFAAYVRSARARFRAGQELPSSSSRFLLSASDYTTLVQKSGQYVAITIAPDRATAERIEPPVPSAESLVFSGA